LVPEEIDIAVQDDADAAVLLSFWVIESSTGNWERRVMLQAIALSKTVQSRPRRRPATRALFTRPDSEGVDFN
jgi:hypothetical protein